MPDEPKQPKHYPIESAFTDGAKAGCSGCAGILFTGAVLAAVSMFWPPFRFVAYIVLVIAGLVALFASWANATDAAQIAEGEHQLGTPKQYTAGIIAVIIAGIGAVFWNASFWTIDFHEEKARMQQEEVEREREKQIEMEFRDYFTFSAPHVTASYRSGGLLHSGEFTLTNKTTLDWKSVYIIINPATEGTADSIAFELGEEHGFRAPGDKNRVYTNVAVDDDVTIPLDRFIHTKTGEKFSTDRYQLRKAYIEAIVEFKGKDFTEDCFIKWSDSD